LVKRKPYRFIISGGGTGGHIYPAIAIANTLRDRYPDAQILFVGAKGKMEMQKVPESGYRIIGLWISGIQRRVTLDNLFFPVKVLVSFFAARTIIKRFQPNVVIGVGGYASGPMVMAAHALKVPVLLQEQNSYAGLTNRKLGKRAATICVAYPDMEAYFEKSKIVITGNPVRKSILEIAGRKEEAMKYFGLDMSKKTLLVIGGSLGARTLNESIVKALPDFIAKDIQVIWQVGRLYYDEMLGRSRGKTGDHIRVMEFIKNMDLAYAAADVVVSRAGALSISEICLAGKPCVLVPSPNVADDHQTKNASALVKRNAALLIPDNKAIEYLAIDAIALLEDPVKQKKLSENIRQLGQPMASEVIVDEIMKLIK
jgi:UDP-N-acetylglucosamine--N-acetylmuramyl-(pentapeptide) pyrophosphoryl-undecaprenol N-acetylglucosamine transferase